MKACKPINVKYLLIQNQNLVFSVKITNWSWNTLSVHNKIWQKVILYLLNTLHRQSYLTRVTSWTLCSLLPLNFAFKKKQQNFLAKELKFFKKREWWSSSSMLIYLKHYIVILTKLLFITLRYLSSNLKL